MYRINCNLFLLIWYSVVIDISSLEIANVVPFHRSIHSVTWKFLDYGSLQMTPILH